MTILHYLWDDIASNLTGYLLRQRWFLGRTRALQQLRLADVAWLRSPPAGLALVFLHCAFGDGPAEFYLMPLGLVLGDRPLKVPPEAGIMPRTPTMAAPAVVYDAVADDSACQFLLDMMKLKVPLPAGLGQIVVQPSPALQAIRGKSTEPLTVERGTYHANRFVQYSQRGEGRVMLKLFSRLEPGLNPDYEIAQFLSEKTHFACMPALAGAISYQCLGVETTVAILHGYEPHDFTAEQLAAQDLERLMEPAKAADLDPSAETIQAEVAKLSLWVSLLGQRTAELHQAFGAEAMSPAFRPEPLAAEDVAEIVTSIVNRAGRAADLWRTDTAQSAFRQRLGQLMADTDLGKKIRCHGDYDLGQILSRRNDFVIIDFEGEPERSITERRRKQSPLKDVAGMVRSFDHAASRHLMKLETKEDRARLTPWVRAWQDHVTGAFLSGYFDHLDQKGLLPADQETYEALLWLITLDKALIDLHRAWDSHPEWLEPAFDAVAALLNVPLRQ